ncbi:MBL fold metallo-hydrolase [Paenibacillus sp. N1-5-1-14]|uniref:MBL fold metallo-hydrolase n=1 Tax=Paenibacillus radicibacter TaxID=2972488 RepID=UPI00215975E4|nr:MBL fold metallo-hydrolase [Paenibacillus radicibacter]MCR8642584.1 MBL fold metallo-hydrolase [Paenibacillus radicibacter]
MPNVITECQHFHIEQVLEGIYVAIVKESSGAIANVGFIDLGESILVFDSFNTQQAAQELRDEIMKLTGKPITHLLNSHWHGDHIRGNQVFHDVTIVSSKQTAQLMQEIHPARIERQQSDLEGLRSYIQSLEIQIQVLEDKQQKLQMSNQISALKQLEISLPKLQLTLPTETFDSTWEIEGSKHRAVFQTLGGGHTASDSFLYIPDAKVIFIGDLVAVHNHMSIMDGNVSNWIAILEQLQDWDIEYVIAGHGKPGGKDWIAKAAQYLRDLDEAANVLKEQGVTPDQLGNVEVPEPYTNWDAGMVYTHNLKHLLSIHS